MEKKSIRVKITEEHIEKGESGSSSKCAVALAVKDVLGCEFVSCGNLFVTGYDCNDNVVTDTFALSKAARDFVENFDLGGPVTPATFVLKNLTNYG